MTHPQPVKPRPLGWLVLPCRLVLAVLFLLAAYLKLNDPSSFVFSIKAFKIIPASADHLTVLATFVIPWCEAIAGLFLLLGIWTRAAATVITLLLLAFTGAIASIIIRNQMGANIDTHCSCFGKLEWPCGSTVGYCQLIRDIIMLIMGLIVIAFGPGPLVMKCKSGC